MEEVMVDPTPLRKPLPGPLRNPGVGRDAENEKSLCFYFSRRVTDEEMRFLHEVMQRAVACMLDGGAGRYTQSEEK
jgi:hypothetical protein